MTHISTGLPSPCLVSDITTPYSRVAYYDDQPRKVCSSPNTQELLTLVGIGGTGGIKIDDPCIWIFLGPDIHVLVQTAIEVSCAFIPEEGALAAWKVVSLLHDVNVYIW